MNVVTKFSQKVKEANHVQSSQTPVFNFLLDLWIYCKTGNNLAEALRQFNLRKRIDSDQGQWTLEG